MIDPIIDETWLAAIEGSDDYRLLRRLEVRESRTNVGRRDGTSIAVVLDTETTGVGEEDVIIELAMRRIRFDPDGIIVSIDKPYAWLEDPGREIPADVGKLTGITDEELRGRSIDEGEALRLLNSAEFVCAHNARFDLGMLVKRLPEAAGLAWACSQNDVDWRASGFEGGRSLGWLLGQIGLFHGAHRAVDDVDAVIALLGHGLPSGRTALAEMVETARAPSWRFRAVGAAFDVKDRLKSRGYGWNAEAREWRREVRDADRMAEEWWLAGQVYCADACPRALGPIVERVDWRGRYA
ncbi:3'-5' exonuclease [Sphingomonas bacterium]|uniref:3'-5' exonuclease n=1 Tax=Sphingomonas bacterium TaxID=1895847 RepID=UPI00157500C9|nr:3'-5' exonuclease [Sphingomonas bacterium]